ncbi:MAG: ATP-binding cassette domain-containing protein [Eubacteriales bacterium]|nr:ATP-binding cassette domain-containing protein [Eubacteriales bacterium]
MSLIHAQELEKSFGERTLFQDVAFDVFEQDHVGFVGVNGCGKTTLLRMIAGLEPHDGKGQLSVSKNAHVAMLDQSPVWETGASLYDAVLAACGKWIAMERELHDIAEKIERNGATKSIIQRQSELQERYNSGGGLTYRARTRSTLLGLGFSEEELSRPISVMSGGQMRKASLAKILLSEADLLLLDEPTNHLDIASLEWLETYLSAYKGAFLLISHDRYFLDRVCNRIFELENGSMRLYSGNYSQSMEKKMDEREFALRKYQNTLREIKRIEGIIVQQRRWNQARNYVTIASKEKQIERIKSTLVKPEDAPQSIHFHLEADALTANEVVVVRGLSKQFEGREIFHGLDLLIRRDEKVCLLGANGCGKTTLLKILTNRIEPDAGSYKLGSNVHVGYYEQGSVRPNNAGTVLDTLNAAFPRYDTKQLRNLLGSFLFRGDDVFKRVCDLSGGEYARIQLLKLMLEGSNVLLLDEPTNHLDIPSCEALENALSEYGGTMLIVTHDRYLANRIADRVLIMDREGIRAFEGDWDAYKEFLAENSSPKEKEPPAARNDYLAARERRSSIAKAKAALKRAEERVHLEETALSNLESRVQSPEVASNFELVKDIYSQIEAQRQLLDSCYLDWEQAEADCQTLLEEEED